MWSLGVYTLFSDHVFILYLNPGDSLLKLSYYFEGNMLSFLFLEAVIKERLGSPTLSVNVV